MQSIEQGALLFRLIGKKKSHDRAAIALTADGLAFAEVGPDEGVPVLKRCGFIASRQADVTGDLQALIKQEQLQSVQLAICLDRNRFNLSLLEAPKVEAREMLQALSWKVKDLIDFPLEKLVMDYVDVPATKSTSTMVYAVTSHADSIQQLVDQAMSGEARLQRIDIPALALQNVTSRLPVAEEGIALLNLTQRDSLLTLGRADKLYLSRGIKVEKNQLQVARQAGGEVAAAWENLLLDIQRSLDYYDSFFVDPPVRHLHIASVAPNHDDLIDYLDQNLAIAVSRLKLEAFTIPNADIELEPEYFGEVLLAIGTALWQTELAA